MGWSCTRDAGLTLDAITELCIKQTGMQNVFHANGDKYMLEVGREKYDGAICGTIWKFVGENIRKSGSLRIEPDGKISRGPAILKKLRVLIFVYDHIRELWRESFGEPTEENIGIQLEKWNQTFLFGGCNHHVSMGLGYLKVVDSARVENLDGETVAEYRHDVFQVI